MHRSAAGSPRTVPGGIRMKYWNRRIVTEDGTFDSVKEHRRWCELKLMEKAGEIVELQRQVPFVVIPKQKDELGKVVEREVKYIADFTYRTRKDYKLVVEDTKGMKTKEYILKRKLMLYRNGIRIQEV